MANFSEEYVGDFGVPEVQIEPTFAFTYDPYRGLDLPEEFYESPAQFYYWELLLELFLSVCGNDTDFPCDGYGEVSVEHCIYYFDGKYAMIY